MIRLFRNQNFRNKIFIISLLVSLIPVTVLGTFCYKQIDSLLLDREKTALHESLIQESNALNSKMDDYTNAMNHILWDNSIREGLSRKYDSNFEMYLAYRDIFDPVVTTYRSFNRDFKKITLYTDKNLNPHGSVIRPLTDIENEPWYDKALNHTKPFFAASGGQRTLKLLARLHTSYNSGTTIVCIDINYSSAFGSMDTLYEQSYGIALTDSDDTLLYSYDTFEPSHSDYALSLQQLLLAASAPETARDYVIERSGGIADDWTLYLYRPVDTISAPAKEITQIVLIIIVLCLISVIFLSSYLSKIIVRPLNHLVDNMNRVEQGDFTITVSSENTDEIGHLVRSFAHMVKQLHHLVEEVLKSKILQQEYEMRALQAQINPHFLYNSLSLINGRALMAGQDDISRMAQLLSTFYRTTLNKGKNTISVRDELENIRSYINIQFIMHSDSFDVTYDIDEGALDFTMINLLLQPLVENAIMHGIDHRETPGRGILTIACALDHGCIRFTVRDNGPGIPKEKLEGILTFTSTGYGIQNVHHRVQLFYGQDYGLHFESTPGQGTTVTLTLPQQIS